MKLKHIFRWGCGITLIALVTACSTESLTGDNELPGDNTPIRLEGMLTRSGNTGPLTGYTNLQLSAKVEKDGNWLNYFINDPLTVESTTSSDRNPLKSTAYYPLDSKQIKLFGHSGAVKTGTEELTLTSGMGVANDAIISNGDDGNGTLKSSGTGNEATLLTFRHVMTKVEVIMDYDSQDNIETPDPAKVQIEFGNKVAKTGTYKMTTNPGSATHKATSYKDIYTLNPGTHYLIPTGETLSGKNTISKLVIDDYTATANDLSDITVPKAIDDSNTESDLTLRPGLSYKLTFIVKRLKVVGVKLTMQPWDIKTGEGDWGYDPYQLQLNFTNSYNATNDENSQINKVILYHNSFQYVGKGLVDSNKAFANFVTLPDLNTNTQLTADLYTKNGLLIKGLSVSYIAKNASEQAKLDINIDANGMVKDNDGYYMVSTPVQFYNMMSNPKSEKYKLTESIDMGNLPISYTPKDFPSGATLDGNGKSILHLELEGNGLFIINNGTLSNVHIAPGEIKASNGDPIGGICSINKGTIEGCINEADIIASSDESQTAGGICGTNQGTGTIKACLNTGNILKGNTVGGICGEEASDNTDAIKACLSTGMLNLKTTGNLGGICGKVTSTTTNGKIVNTCYWLTGTARKVQSTSNELAVGNDEHSAHSITVADLAPERIRVEGMSKLNNALSSSGWLFKWEKNTSGFYDCVWPMPIKSTNKP